MQVYWITDFLSTTAGKHWVAHLESEGHDFENKLKGKHSSEDKVEDVKGMGVYLWLPSELHGQWDSIEHDEHKDGILKGLGCDKPPDLVLETVLGDVTSHRLGLQRKLYAIPLRVTRMLYIVLGNITLKC